MTAPKLMEEYGKLQKSLPFSASTPEKQEAARITLGPLLRRIPPRMAEVLIAYYWSGLSLEVLGKQRGISGVGMWNRVYVARGAVRLVASLPGWPGWEETRPMAEGLGEDRLMAETLGAYLRTWQTVHLHYEDGSPIPQGTSYARLRTFRTRRTDTLLGQVVWAVMTWERPCIPSQARRRKGPRAGAKRKD